MYIPSFSLKYIYIRSVYIPRKTRTSNLKLSYHMCVYNTSGKFFLVRFL